MADAREVTKRFSLALDISRPISNRAFTLVEGDTGNELTIALTDDGEPVNLSGCRVMALFCKSDATTVSQDSGSENSGITLGGDAGNEITMRLFASSFAPGMVECEVQVYSGATLSTLVTSAKFNFRCRRSILNADTIQAVPEYPLLTSLLLDTNTLAQQTAGALVLAQAVEAQEALRSAAESARFLSEGARCAAEAARAGSETARESAETARAAAEAARALTCTALENRLDLAIGDADELTNELTHAVEGLPEFSTVLGILKGDGAGGVSAAAAGTDYATPAQVAAKAAPAADYTASLTTAWSGSSAPFTQTVAIAGLSASAKIFVGLASGATDAEYAAASAAQLMCTAQAANQITVTARGTKPTIALPLLIRTVS